MTAQQHTCKGCGQPLWGSYITALGASWHPEHFVCAACGRPLESARFNLHEGRPYHAECYHNQIAPRCAYCNKPLIGQYYEHEGRSYHAECYHDHVVPRCASCNKPLIGQYYTHEGARYHAECYHNQIAPRCAYCHKPLMSGYVIDHWGAKYCKEHQDQYPKCGYCGRLVAPQQQESRVKRSQDVRCPVCRASAIESMTQAQLIFNRLMQWMSTQGLHYNKLQLPLELVDRATLAGYLKGHATKDTLGVTASSTHTVNGQVVRTEVSGIAVLHGLPTTLFQGVTVHELGHAWLTIQGIRGLPPWAEEGFCELLSYRFYTEMGTPVSRYHAECVEQNKDQVYGEGFRRVRAVANALGFARFIERLRTTKRLPTGAI